MLVIINVSRWDRTTPRILWAQWSGVLRANRDAEASDNQRYNGRVLRACSLTESRSSSHALKPQRSDVWSHTDTSASLSRCHLPVIFMVKYTTAFEHLEKAVKGYGHFGWVISACQ